MMLNVRILDDVRAKQERSVFSTTFAQLVSRVLLDLCAEFLEGNASRRVQHSASRRVCNIECCSERG